MQVEFKNKVWNTVIPYNAENFDLMYQHSPECEIEITHEEKTERIPIRELIAHVVKPVYTPAGTPYIP